MIIAKIPFDFVRQKIRLTWRDVYFALDRQLVSPMFAIEFAKQLSAATFELKPEEQMLVSAKPHDPVIDLVRDLAATEAIVEESTTSSKWLYLLLAWLYENRELFEDPLGVVERIYADFDYPAEIVDFVRHMPMVGPDLGSRTANEGRLYAYWEDYMAEASQRFSRD